MNFSSKVKSFINGLLYTCKINKRNNNDNNINANTSTENQVE